MQGYHPIGIFDSGFGGLTIMKDIVAVLPQYDYLYLGDNARTPYGNRSFETVYQYTLECVQHLFNKGCRLIILACNTASAKALRSIQQINLPALDPHYRVLGVIRPTSETIGAYSSTGKIGVLATRGTVNSQSYIIEIEKFFPQLQVFQQACPMWVPLVENNEHLHSGADYFVKEYLNALMAQSADIDTLLLACTHYPLLINKIKQFAPAGMQIVAQGQIVAQSLKNYLGRHEELEATCSKNGQRHYFTTDDPYDFNQKAAIFLGDAVHAAHLSL